jgi:hypothetical protein
MHPRGSDFIPQSAGAGLGGTLISPSCTTKIALNIDMMLPPFSDAESDRMLRLREVAD